jgi:hypothetical protein
LSVALGVVLVGVILAAWVVALVILARWLFSALF